METKTKIAGIIIILFSQLSMSQDFIRIGLANDFRKDKLVQTFTFDFNRTEKTEEKEDRNLFKSSRYYVLPTCDINIGDGVTASENNILFQGVFGKLRPKHMWKSKDGLTNYFFQSAWELNPTYNADKLFDEKLYYGQLKYLLNFIPTYYSNPADSIHVRKVNSVYGGVFVNAGIRDSKIFDDKKLYTTTGFSVEAKSRIINADLDEVLVLKLSGDYYYIISDIDSITTDQFAGILKASATKRLFDEFYVGLDYKYGNDNPKYSYVNTLDLSIKYNY